MPPPTANKHPKHAARNKKHQGRKRPRTNTNKDEEQQQKYYDRLAYQCRKELHKQAKQTKTFITQKLIRKLKDSATPSSATSLKQQQQKMQQVKDYALEPVLEECFRRLGLRQLDPQLQQKSVSKEDEEELKQDSSHQPAASGDNDDDINKQQYETNQLKAEKSNLPHMDKDDDDDESEQQNSIAIGSDGSKMKLQEAENAVSKENSVDTIWILERILQHKRMVTALEHWNDQVTEYRRWCLQQQERAEGLVTTIARPKKDRKKKRIKTDTAYEQDALVAADHSVFVTLGGDDNPHATTVASASADNYYGPASDGTLPVKRNRKGQRARHAKAQAIEARKSGRVLRPEESLNWRRPSNRHESSLRQDHQQQHQHASRTNQPPAEDPKGLHPSWQARKEKKDGIVAFQGKKITFD